MIWINYINFTYNMIIKLLCKKTEDIKYNSNEG